MSGRHWSLARAARRPWHRPEAASCRLSPDSSALPGAAMPAPRRYRDCRRALSARAGSALPNRTWSTTAPEHRCLRESAAHRRPECPQTRSQAARAVRCSASLQEPRDAQSRDRPCSPRAQPSKRMPTERRGFVSPRARLNALCYRLVYSLISQQLAMTVHSEAAWQSRWDRFWKLVSSLLSVKVVGLQRDCDAGSSSRRRYARAADPQHNSHAHVAAR